MDNNQNFSPNLPPLPTPPVPPMMQMSSQQDFFGANNTPDLQLPKRGRNTLKSIILPTLALFLVVGVATASYFVSNRINQQGKVALNAPESEPMAAEPCSVKESEQGCGAYDCPSDKNRVCKCSVVNNAEKWSCSCESADKCITGGNENNKACSGSSAGKCQNKAVDSACDKDPVTGKTIAKCTLLPNQDRCECISTGGGGGDNTNGDSTGGGSNSCKSAIANNTLTFEKSGTIMTFTKGLKGKITLERENGEKFEIVSERGGTIEQTKKFTVMAGEKIIIDTYQGTSTKPGVGWTEYKSSTNKCGPVNSACGTDVDIKDLIDLANIKVDLSGIKSDKSANVQCWGDMGSGDETTDYDFNDYMVVFGYAKAPLAQCVIAQVAYKNTSGAWVTITDKASIPTLLKAGDSAKIMTTASSEATKVRFRVKNGTTNVLPTEWVEVTTSTAVSGGKQFSYEFTMGTAGTYSFEAQVQ